jgi:hypothetical protein
MKTKILDLLKLLGLFALLSIGGFMAPIEASSNQTEHVILK